VRNRLEHELLVEADVAGVDGGDEPEGGAVRVDRRLRLRVEDEQALMAVGRVADEADVAAVGRERRPALACPGFALESMARTS
jgi:hypothetical protein